MIFRLYACGVFSPPLYFNLFFVASPPDLSSFGFFNQVVPEIRVSNGDQFFRPIPSWTGFQGYCAVFGHNEIDHLPGHGRDTSDIKVRNNAGFNRAVLLLVSRRQADETATAFGPVSVQYKVRHSAIAGPNLVERRQSLSFVSRASKGSRSPKAPA